MRMEPHNPDYRLVGVKNGSLEYVYGIRNDGENEGLEVYYYDDYTTWEHYRSRRWTVDRIPEKYLTWFRILQRKAAMVPAGHRLTLTVDEALNE